MIAAGLLSLSLLSGGHGSLALLLFPADFAAALKAVVTEPARSAEAVRIVEQSKKDVDASLKRGAEIAKEFASVDTRHETRLAELEPFLKSMADERKRARSEALDSVFALKKTVTEEEWKAAYARSKK